MSDTENYTAADIRILPELEAVERFAFARAADLARRYPHVADEFIRRLVEACDLSGCPIEIAESRYLAGDRAVDVPPELVACHAELARAAHAG